MPTARRGFAAISTSFLAVLLAAVSGTCADDAKQADPPPAWKVPGTVVMEEVACPFDVTDAERERVDQTLAKWEERSGAIRSFRCKFTHRNYHAALGNGDPRVSQGEITYRWPNKASYRVLGSARERWERDEKAIRRFDYDQKVMFEHPLTAAENQTDSWPVPLLYQVRAADLKRDYWIRVIDAPREGEIWLELRPRQRPVQANMVRLFNDVMSTGCSCRYQPLDIVLREDNFEPSALRVRHTDGSRTTYVFSDVEADIECPGRTLSEILCELAPLPNGWIRREH
jgi:hypothetical protein